MEKNISKVKKSVQEMQDEIFRKMSGEEKIRLASELTEFCVKLNRLGLNGDHRHRKIIIKSGPNS